MARKLHLFNPENDLALAHGAANFTPPRVVREFHRAGALLPAWYAAPGDYIVADHSLKDELRSIRQDVEIWDGGDLSGADYDIEPAPWGWSANAVRQFEALGVRSHPPLPPIVELSHRRTAAHLLAALDGTVGYALPPAPEEVTSVDELRGISGCFFMKAPWSGSGRGVIDCSLLPERQVRFIADGIIRHQGSVMVEPKLDKVVDFAMLFSSESDGIVHRGYSLFFNSSANAYGGNIIASQYELLERIAAYGCRRSLIEATAGAVKAALARIVSPDRYTGPVGVDMMLYRAPDGELLIAPAVEINFRMTMGFVAMHVFERLVRRGTMCVNYGAAMPSGAMALLPPYAGFSFTFEPIGK